MPIQPLPRVVVLLRHDPVQRIAHVGPDIRVPVLVHAQRAAGVLHEEMQDADPVVLDLWQLRRYLVGDEVGAARPGGHGERSLEPGHGAGRGRRGSSRGMGRLLGGGPVQDCEGQSHEVVEDGREEAEDEEGEEEEGLCCR